MTPFRRGGPQKRPHLRMVEFGDATDAEVTVDPNAPPPQPPPPRQVVADPSQVVPDSPALDTNAPRGSSAMDLMTQGLFVGLGYGVASEALKFFLHLIFGAERRAPPTHASGLAGTQQRRRRRKQLTGG